MLLWLPEQTPFSLHNICLDCRNSRGCQRKKAHWKLREKTCGTNQPDKLIFLLTCLWEPGPGCPFWKEVISASHLCHLSDHVVQYFLHGLIPDFAKT